MKINHLDWNRVADHQETVDYVRGLIKLRKSSPHSSAKTLMMKLKPPGCLSVTWMALAAYQLEDEKFKLFRYD